MTNIGLSHFFRKEEFDQLLAGFSVIDPCLSTYYLPQSEAKKATITPVGVFSGISIG